MHKIYWYGFKRQLYEFYHLLSSENIISCGVDEFFSHFTGKKLAIENDYISKIKWQGGVESMQVIIHHLAEKRFLQQDDTELKVFKSHFRVTAKSNKMEQRLLRKKLELLFPATSGYSCKERLFYKARNKDSISKLLNDLNIKPKS
jgi:hypothetical protein